MLPSAKLQKLTIYAFADEGRSIAHRKGKFEAQFNPESYSMSYALNFDQGQGINTSGIQPKYLASKPKKLSLQLIFDGTGVTNVAIGVLSKVPKLATPSVLKQEKSFLETTYRVLGSEHEPPHLTLSWGEMSFECRLETVDIKHTQFDRAGNPTRATLDCVFEAESIPSGSMFKTSPDLTHRRIAKAGDSLPSLCQEIYGSGKHYRLVAKHNRLSQFRKLKPGTPLDFPPLPTR